MSWSTARTAAWSTRLTHLWISRTRSRQAGRPRSRCISSAGSASRVGELVLLEGQRAVGWSIAGGAEAELWAAAQHRSASAERASLPYRLEPGQLGWLLADISALAGGSWIAACAGRNIKVTALLNGRVVGRIWLPGAGRPTITGGDPNIAYLPAPWLSGAGDRLALLVEAVERDAPGELSEVEFRAVQ